MMMQATIIIPYIILYIIVTCHINNIKQVNAWSWSRPPISSTYGPQVSGHTCVTFPVNDDDDDGKSNKVVNNKNDKIYLFGGQLPQPDLIGGVGASLTSTKASRRTTLKEAMEQSRLKKLAEEVDVVAEATHDLWVYEKDKLLDNNNDNDCWKLITRKEQGISRPTPRIHAASARLGHMMYLFGGIDPTKNDNNKQLNDVWTLSLNTHKWSLSQAILPSSSSSSCKLVACSISNTKVVLLSGSGNVMVYDDDLPTPTIVGVHVDNYNGPMLSKFACCGIPRSNDDEKDANGGGHHDAVDDLHGYISRSMNYVKASEGELKDVLIYGGDKSSGSLSSDVFRLDTKLWKWTKLNNINSNTDDNHPRALIDASLTSIGNNQCILYGGTSFNEHQQRMEVCDETWLLTIDNNNNEVSWERIANLPNEDVVGSGGGGAVQHPEGRTFATLIATSPDELVLTGGYNPVTKQTYGGTFLLTRHPIDHAKIAMEKEAREQEIKDSQLTELEAAQARASDIIAATGSGMGFDGGTLGVGGLDHVLEEVKTRIWTPLAAPPNLLKELGIQPTRGLLL